MQVVAPGSLEIRRWRAADEPFIGRLATRAFAEYDAQPSVTMEGLIQRGVTWVALRATVPLGFAVVQVHGTDSAELCAIAVEEEMRGVGIGRALLVHVERALLRAGVKQLRLHTAQSNLSALELFLKCGFRVEQRLPRFYRGVYDACALAKTVGADRR